ncbi:hypothetical protein GC176_04575 [bacterium]|nr:hypothetical protein [bacterium]
MTWTPWHGPGLPGRLACFAGLFVSVAGCSVGMQFPQTVSTVSYRNSPIQQTSGRLAPLVVVDNVRDNRGSKTVGSVAFSSFDADSSLSDYIRTRFENEVSSSGASLARNLSDAQAGAQNVRRVSLAIRQTNYGGANMFYRTVAAINLLVEVYDESGTRIFAQTYAGSAEKRPVLPSGKESGKLMSDAVDQAIARAMNDGNLRSVLGY